MNEPTSILEQARRRGNSRKRRDVATAATRRGAAVLALVVLLLTTGVGSMPNMETGAQGLELGMASKPARAETPTDEGAYSEELLSVRSRHKTH
jgi:hypothetical protein